MVYSSIKRLVTHSVCSHQVRVSLYLWLVSVFNELGCAVGLRQKQPHVYLPSIAHWRMCAM